VRSRKRRILQIRREFQKTEKSRRKTYCPQKERGKKKGKELRSVESLSKWESKRRKEIRDPKKNLRYIPGGTIEGEIYHGRALIPIFLDK